MKKIVVIAVVIFGITTKLSAQKRGDVEFGVNIGLNSSSASDSKYTYDSNRGFNVGGSMDYYFSKSWSLKAKVIYDQKGWNNDVILNLSDNQYYPTNYNLDYLTIPVMANWHFGSHRAWYLSVGPYVGFLLTAKDTYFNSDIKRFLNTTDFGLTGAAGFKIPISNKLKFFVELEGQGGLTDINKQSQNSALLNSRGSLNIGLNFLMK